MDNKTNKGLVEYSKKSLNEKWGYVWGTFGQTLTETLFNQKLNQYPNQVGNFKSFIKANWMGRKVSDCVGLIKSYMWFDEDNNKVIYNSKTDVNANMMYTNAKEKGTINTIPEIIGLCLYKQGHIGVYIGNGQVIEARGTKYGVIQTPLKGVGSTPWTHWLKCPYIEYVEEIKEESKPLILKLGCKGQEVKQLQKNLIILGYDLGKWGADGDFGNATFLAVKKLQEKYGLKPIDGIVGKDTFGLIDRLLVEKDKVVEIPKEEKPIVVIPNDKKYKYSKVSLTHVVEVDPMELRISVQDKSANTIKLSNFVTSGFQMEQADKTKLPIYPTSNLLIQNGKYKTYPLGILVSEGHIIQNRQPHNKSAGTLIVYKNGRVECKSVLNLLTETDYNNIWFAVSGCSILPTIRMNEEGFSGRFSDIGRTTNRPVIGYNPTKNKIVIAVRPMSDIARGQSTLKNLGCSFGITLDAGGSTILRVDDKTYMNTTRRLFSVISW